MCACLSCARSPQENGNKEDVSLAILKTRPAAAADRVLNVLIVGSSRLGKLGIEAHHFPDEAFGASNMNAAQSHTSDLRPTPYTFVHVDFRQQGVGGIDSWGQWSGKEAPLAAYTIPYREMRLRFALDAMEGSSEDDTRAKAVSRAHTLEPLLNE